MSLKFRVKSSNPPLPHFTKGGRGRVISLLLAACCLLLVTCCGYRFHGKESLQFTSVKIGKIENRTYEPKLEDKFQRALADELLKNGIMISETAEHSINGTIDYFELKPLAEKDGLTVEYEVIIRGRFSLKLPDGNVKQLQSRGAFIVSFYNEGELQSVMASKEIAIEKALQDLSSEIRAGIIYQY